MAHIEKRKTSKGETRYRAQVILKGQPRISQTFSTRRAATRWAERTTEAIRQRRYQPESEPERRTLGELVDRFVEEKLPELRAGDRPHLTGKLHWWCDQLGRDIRLGRITPAAITIARDNLARGQSLSGKVPSPHTVKRYLAILSRAMSVAAREWWWMDDNPCARVVRPKEPRARMRFLDDQERQRLLTVCETSRKRRLHPLVVLAVSTGARQGELLSLKWQDVGLDRGVAIVHHSKNGERRALAITGLADQVLREWSAVRRIDCDLVFHNRHGKPLFPKYAWADALAEAEIEDFRFHDLRHTFVSYLAMSGATLAELAEALGHKTLAMVKRYAHLTEGHTAGVVARMNQRFLGG